MQQCKCGNAYKYPTNGGTVCVVCGEDWPDTYEKTEEDKAVKALAKKLYSKHLKLNSEQEKFMWNQCHENYQKAWIAIAEGDLEDPIADEKAECTISEGLVVVTSDEVKERALAVNKLHRDIAECLNYEPWHVNQITRDNKGIVKAWIHEDTCIYIGKRLDEACVALIMSTFDG